MDDSDWEKLKFRLNESTTARVYLYSVIDSLTSAKGIANKMYFESVADPTLIRALQWYIFTAMNQFFRFVEASPAKDAQDKVMSEDVQCVLDRIDEILKEYK